jgi:hypothetical protein
MPPIVACFFLSLGRVEVFSWWMWIPNFLARLSPVRAISTGLPLTEATSSCLGTFPVSDLSVRGLQRLGCATLRRGPTWTGLD